MSKRISIVHPLLLNLIVGMVLLVSSVSAAYGSVFRSATLSWQAQDPAHPNVVTFKLRAQLRWSYPSFNYTVGTQKRYGAYPPYEALVNLRSILEFDPTGSWMTIIVPPDAKVISVGFREQDFFIVETSFTYTYPEVSATYTPRVRGSARWYDLQNGNGEMSYSMQAQISIDMSAPHDSPVVIMPEVITVPRGQVTSFLMGAYAPLGGELTYSIAPSSETGMNAAVPYRGARTNPIPIMTLDKNTGLMTWDTRGAAGAEVALGHYGVQLRAADAWGNYTFREFVVDLVTEGSGTPPTLTINNAAEPPSLAIRSTGYATFDLKGEDADYDNATGLRQQITMYGPAGFGSAWQAAPLTQTARWTPPSFGTFVIPYWVVDSTWMVGTVPVTIHVTEAPKMTCSVGRYRSIGVEATSAEGATLSVSGAVKDPDSANATVTWWLNSEADNSRTLQKTDTVNLTEGTGSTSWDYTLRFGGWYGIESKVSDELGETPEEGCQFMALVTDSTPPTIPTLKEVGAPATSRSGTPVSFVVPDAIDLVDGAVPLVCTPASGSLFAMGHTSVRCTATDTHKNSSNRYFSVAVYDTAPVIPPLFPPSGVLLVEASSSSGGLVHYTVPMAHDALDGDIRLDCAMVDDPNVMLAVPFGDTRVYCKAKDSGGLVVGSSFVIRVRDTTPPVIPALTNITVEATGPIGALVSYTLPNAMDLVDGAVALVCAPSSGSAFSIGNNSVACTAKDSRGNTAHSGFTVTVRDSMPPIIPALTNIIAEATSSRGAVVSYTVPNAADAVDGAIVLICAPATGSTFALGSTAVQCSATDRAGNSARTSLNVIVRDTTPPVIETVTPSTRLLWPPNHQMSPIVVSYSVSDNTTATCTLAAVSNERDNGLGDGDTPGDVRVISPTKVELRAERAGNGNGRVYTLNIRCTDSYGNFSTSAAMVAVAKSMGGGKK